MGVRRPVSTVRGLIVTALWTATPAAIAQADATRWGCHVANQHLVCRVEQITTATATTTPIDPRLPPIVHTLRQQPASWRGRLVRIPLFNEPFDDSPLQPLAQAVLCGAVRHCRAEVGRDGGLSTLALLDFADANDPLLQPGE